MLVLIPVAGAFVALAVGIRQVLVPMLLNLLTGLGANPDNARTWIRILAEA